MHFCYNFIKPVKKSKRKCYTNKTSHLKKIKLCNLKIISFFFLCFVCVYIKEKYKRTQYKFPKKPFYKFMSLFTSLSNPKWRCMNDSHCSVMLILSRYDFGTTSLGNSFKVSHILALLTTAFLARINCSVHKCSSTNEINVHTIPFK
jgi:hypothetical protein